MLYILIPAALDMYYHLFSHHLAIFKLLLLGFRAFIVALLTSFHLFLFADFFWVAHMLFPLSQCFRMLQDLHDSWARAVASYQQWHILNVSFRIKGTTTSDFLLLLLSSKRCGEKRNPQICSEWCFSANLKLVTLNHRIFWVGRDLFRSSSTAFHPPSWSQPSFNI